MAEKAEKNPQLNGVHQAARNAGSPGVTNTIATSLPGTWFFLRVDLATNEAFEPWWEMTKNELTSGQNFAISLLALFKNVWGKQRCQETYPLEGEFRIHGFELAGTVTAADQMDRIHGWFGNIVESLVKYQYIVSPSFSTAQLVIDAVYQPNREAMFAEASPRKPGRISLPPGEAQLDEDETAAVLQDVSKLTINLESGLRPLQADFQQLLTQLAGKSFGSLAANQIIAHALQELAEQLQVRVVCPRPGCDEGAVLECRRAGATKYGSFQFRHRSGERHVNHFSSTSLPAMKLKPAPIRLKRKRNSAVLKDLERKGS